MSGIRFADPRCTCVAGSRCEACRRRGQAHYRMYRLAGDVNRYTHPVEYVDQKTSMNDARAALCMAMGIPLQHIDPCTGHDRSNYPRGSR